MNILKIKSNLGDENEKIIIIKLIDESESKPKYKERKV